MLKFDENFRECNDYVQRFHRTIEQYSALQLTKSSNRLPALSGLCTQMQPFRGRYAAGIWMDSIAFDLLWRVNMLNTETSCNPITDEYIGPSWSWIVILDLVHYWADILNFFDPLRVVYPPVFEMHGQTCRNPNSSGFRPSKTTPLGRNTESIQLELQTTGKNPLDSVAHAVLTVEAYYINASLKYTHDSFWHGGSNKLNPSRYKLTIAALDPVLESESEHDLHFFADYPLAVEGPRHIPELTVLSLLSVHPWVALVLVPVLETMGSKDQKEDLWKRIGIVRISNELVSLYRVDWMSLSVVKEFRIV